jgi:hypothetical protein
MGRDVGAQDIGGRSQPCHHGVEDIGRGGIGHHEVDETADGVGELRHRSFPARDGGMEALRDLVAHRVSPVVVIIVPNLAVSEPRTVYLFVSRTITSGGPVLGQCSP